MGRWAQARRRGGSALSPVVDLRHLVSATQTADDQITIRYDMPLTAGQHQGINAWAFRYKVQPSGFEGVTITSDGNPQFILLLEDDAPGQTSLEWTGPVTGVLTPQTIPIT